VDWYFNSGHQVRRPSVGQTIWVGSEASRGAKGVEVNPGAFAGHVGSNWILDHTRVEVRELRRFCLRWVGGKYVVAVADELV
jgi:hypothetical protein